jgi:L-malate glycosyltransferase
MFITVLLATCNRSDILREVLESYCRLLNPEPWKILVVDNGSTDATRTMVESFISRLPIAYIFEPRPGKTVAVNAGLAEIKGDLLLFTDDDAPVCPEWLESYRRAAHEHPDHDIFAGPVVPRFPAPPPAWISDNLAIMMGAFAASNPGLREGQISDPGQVVGSNFAVRSGLARKHQFNSAIGPREASQYCLGDETEFVARLKFLGHRIWWVENAPVRHIIRPEQVSKTWVRQRAVKLGRGACYEDQGPSQAPDSFGIPRWALKRLGKQGVKMFRHGLFGNEAQSFAARFDFIRTRSMLSEMRKIAKANESAQQ